MNNEIYTINAIFDVEENFNSNNKEYIITLSKQNVKQMCEGFTDHGCLFGISENNCEFYIFQNPAGKTSESFQMMPDCDGNGYYIYFGAVKEPTKNLEEKIRTSEKIPIKINGAQRELTIGYVTLRLE